MTENNATRKIAAVTFAKALVTHLMLIAIVVFEDNFIMNACFYDCFDNMYCAE